MVGNLGVVETDPIGTSEERKHRWGLKATEVTSISLALLRGLLDWRIEMAAALEGLTRGLLLPGWWPNELLALLWGEALASLSGARLTLRARIIIAIPFLLSSDDVGRDSSAPPPPDVEANCGAAGMAADEAIGPNLPDLSGDDVSDPLEVPRGGSLLRRETSPSIAKSASSSLDLRGGISENTLP